VGYQGRRFVTTQTLRPLPDYLRPGLDVVFVGTNPGTVSAERGHYYANPLNPFWTLLSESGLAPEPLGPEDDERANDFGIGFTDIVKRPTPGIDQLPPQERRDGGPVLQEKLEACRPRVVCFNGKEVYRWFSGRSCELGLQRERVAGAAAFVMPSTSPRNARWRPADKLKFFCELKRVVDRERANG
jgi:mismatch-specific thymine-DNA glycosylase